MTKTILTFHFQTRSFYFFFFLTALVKKMLGRSSESTKNTCPPTWSFLNGHLSFFYSIFTSKTYAGILDSLSINSNIWSP